MFEQQAQQNDFKPLKPKPLPKPLPKKLVVEKPKEEQLIEHEPLDFMPQEDSGQVNCNSLDFSQRRQSTKPIRRTISESNMLDDLGVSKVETDSGPFILIDDAPKEDRAQSIIDDIFDTSNLSMGKAGLA